jgi:hypothetical protein
MEGGGRKRPGLCTSLGDENPTQIALQFAGRKLKRLPFAVEANRSWIDQHV